MLEDPSPLQQRSGERLEAEGVGPQLAGPISSEKQAEPHFLLEWISYF